MNSFALTLLVSTHLLSLVASQSSNAVAPSFVSTVDNSNSLPADVSGQNSYTSTYLQTTKSTTSPTSSLITDPYQYTSPYTSTSFTPATWVYGSTLPLASSASPKASNNPSNTTPVAANNIFPMAPVYATNYSANLNAITTDNITASTIPTFPNTISSTPSYPTTQVTSNEIP